MPSKTKPRVRMTEADHETLSSLARLSETAGAELLARELDRAVVIKGDVKAPFVRLGSSVTYRDLTTGRDRTVTVTGPEEADIDLGRISVLTPVGAALIGLSTGDVFGWETAGKAREVEITAISDPA